MDFGTVAILLLVNNLVTILASAGLASVVIQFRDLKKSDLKPILGYTTIFSVGIYIFILLISNKLTDYFSNPNLYEILPYGCFVIIVTPGAQIVEGLLFRDFKFGWRASLLILSSSIGAIFGIILAICDYGYWALVWQILARMITFTAVGLVLFRIYPTFIFNLSVFKNTFSYMMNLILYRLISYTSDNTDNFLIGRDLGSILLGYYSRAFVLYNVILNSLLTAFLPVLHTSFSKVRYEDRRLLKQEVLNTVKMIFSIVLPVLGICYIYAEELVITVWGSDWDVAIDPFRFLIIAAIFRPIQIIGGEIAKTINLTSKLITWGLLGLIFLVVSIRIGIMFGLSGVAAGVAIGSSLYSLLFGYVIFVRHLNVNYSEIKDLFLTILFLLSSICLEAYLLKIIIIANIQMQLGLIISIVLLSLTIYALLWITKNPAYTLILNLLGILKVKKYLEL